MTRESAPFPKNLREFVDIAQWTFAKTMPDWPHEYIVRDKVDNRFFVELVTHIRNNGYIGNFYQKEIIYSDNDGLVYWTMGAPIEETTIINRCKKENSFEYRFINNLLPESTFFHNF
jgi:hypothetical protein